MTITVTADVAFSPPRNEVEVSVPAGEVMTEVAVWRNDSSGRSLVRSQPAPGFESRTVFDYECPYGQAVTYDWAATYFDPANNVTTFSEPWSSFPGSWTGDTGSASILSNRVTVSTTEDVAAGILRDGLNVDWDQIEVDYFATTGTVPPFGWLEFSFTGPPLELSVQSGNVYVRSSSLGIFVATDTSVSASSPFTITRSNTTFSVAGTGGSYSWNAGATGNLTTIRIGYGAGAGPTPPANPVTATVGEITVSTIASTSTVAETSSPVTLTPTNAWLIAPQAPALSFPLSNSNQQAAGIRELGPVGNGSNTTIHRILGTSTPVTTTTGNRQADTLTATIYTHTSQERQDLRALLSPDTPILINVPPAWDLDLAYGFYQAGDVTETRPYTLGGVPMRDHTIPLTRVRSPEVDVENPGWSYAQVATVWATYTEVLGNYDTYADLTVDNRN